MATVIMNKAELAAINGSSGSFELGADILDWDLPAIPTFTGELDGKGHTITGVMTKEVGVYWVRIGLFGSFQGIIHDIIFEDCIIDYTGESGIAGILAGRADMYGGQEPHQIYNITMINCSISMNIDTPDYHGYAGAQAGLIVGYLGGAMSGCFTDSDCSVTLWNSAGIGYALGGMLSGFLSGYDGYISNCGAAGSVTCTADGSGVAGAGGLLGIAQNAIIENCYSEVAVSCIGGAGGIYSMAGGLHAQPSAAALTVINCYNTGTISSSGFAYGLGLITTATSSYWLDTCGGTGGGGVSKTDTQLKQQATFVDWDFDTVWAIGEGSTYPVLQDGAKPVSTLPATDLDWFKCSATFNGSSCGMTQVWFKWGSVGLEHTSIKIPAAPRFSIYLHGAARDYTYYFQAVGEDADGNLYYGETFSFELIQTVAADAYVTKLIIRGQPLVPLETMTLIASDATSIAAYGKRTYSLSTQYSLSQDDTQVILNTILATNKDPRVNNLIVTFQGLKPGTFKDSVIAADISTRITLINTSLGIDGDFFVNNIKHSITEAGLFYTVEWRLERVYDTTPEP